MKITSKIAKGHLGGEVIIIPSGNFMRKSQSEPVVLCKLVKVGNTKVTVERIEHTNKEFETLASFEFSFRLDGTCDNENNSAKLFLTYESYEDYKRRKYLRENFNQVIELLDFVVVVDIYEKIKTSKEKL